MVKNFPALGPKFSWKWTKISKQIQSMYKVGIEQPENLQTFFSVPCMISFNLPYEYLPHFDQNFPGNKANIAVIITEFRFMIFNLLPYEQ